MNTKEEVINIVSDVLEVDKNELNENTNLVKDLKAESLDLVDLVSAFEEKYNFEIPDKDIKNLETIGDIIKYIDQNV